MPKAIDYSGQRIKNTTVIDFCGHDSNGTRLWSAKCDCGNVFVARIEHMRRSGTCPQCGRKRQAQLIKKHGDYKSQLYHVWMAMRQRCSNPNAQEYHNYGARGIEVCDEWNNSWLAFKEWAMQNGYTKGLSIERIDVNGNYEPSNCKWIPLGEQGLNKRTSRIITYGGRSMSVTSFAREFGLRPCVVERRLIRGWTVERALTTPLQTNMIHR